MTSLPRRRCDAFTFLETMFASAVFAAVTVGLLTFSHTAVRLIARNLSTNHSHEIVRISDQRLLQDLHDSASPFRLITFDGTTFADATVSATTDTDTLSQKLISTRANGVRFRRLAGGPYRITANVTTTGRDLTLAFGVGGALPYLPQVGDKMLVPLIAREFDISAVPTMPASGSTSGTVTIADTAGLGFSIDATTAGNVTTAYFYREVAYTVFNSELRYHANFTGGAKTDYSVIRSSVTSPKPFSLLYATSASNVDGTNVRISLEAYDSDYTARRFTNGAVTLQAVIPTRTIPTPISSTNYY